MHKINLYTISKKDQSCYEKISNDFIKMAKKYGKIEVFSIFNKSINQAQNRSSSEAKKSYTKALGSFLKDGLNIALDPKGKELDSFEFAEIFEENIKINFFIGGAFGFEEEFLKRCDQTISLSRLTFSHKIAKITLLEQIYRAFAIINSHPYHK